jgi:hypothetical protein
MDSEIIEKLPTTKTIFDDRTGQELVFSLDKDKIHFFCDTYLPKWENNKHYYLISQKLWGIHQQILLYVDSTGTDFLVEYYH